ncbi:hypothetical protein CDL12_14563 [Handroanthus impetiginosus]|uniref:Uncharacterized protein n=1 Tax=Handroanthus impetiginosus TaxID=429701 RepID=A0A2G9H5M9_9LAMI|nr:hypothetical protein CDL12_14563 [Handroanthus impetiginosus]
MINMRFLWLIDVVVVIDWLRRFPLYSWSRNRSGSRFLWSVNFCTSFWKEFVDYCEAFNANLEKMIRLMMSHFCV